MKIEFANMAVGDNYLIFIIRYFANIIRTWYYFNIKWPWVKYGAYNKYLLNPSKKLDKFIKAKIDLILTTQSLLTTMNF